MKTKIKTIACVSLLMAMVVLMSTVMLHSDLTRMARLQAVYEICAVQMHTCPSIQTSWASLR